MCEESWRLVVRNVRRGVKGEGPGGRCEPARKEDGSRLVVRG